MVSPEVLDTPTLTWMEVEVTTQELMDRVVGGTMVQAPEEEAVR